MDRLSRLQASTYSDAAQAASARAGGTWALETLGQLRLDSLAFRTISVTDAALLDGRFFQEIDPRDLIRWLTRFPGSGQALEIRARGDSFEECLRRFLFRDEHLAGLWFDSIDDPEVQFVLSEQLRTVPREYLVDRLASTESVVTTLIELFRALLVAQGVDGSMDLERLDRSWRAWTAIAPDSIPFRRWGDPRCRYRDALAAERFDLSALPPDVQALIPDLARFTDDNRPYRADMRAYFHRVRSEVGADNASAVSALEGWLERGWERMVAYNNDCSYASDSITEAGVDPRVDTLTDEERVASLPAGFLSGLGALPSDEFKAITGQSAADLNAWWTTQDRKALGRVLERARGRVTPSPFERRGFRDFFVELPAIAAGGAAGYETATHLHTSSPITSAVTSAAALSLKVVASVSAEHARSGAAKRRLIEYISSRVSPSA